MAGLPVWNRPLYLVTNDMPVEGARMPRSVQAKMTELRAALQALVVEASQIEADLLQLAVEGTLKEYGESWMGVVREGFEAKTKAMAGIQENNEAFDQWFASERQHVLDVLTRSALNSLPIQVVSSEHFDELLRRHTTINLDIIAKMCESFDRLAAR